MFNVGDIVTVDRGWYEEICEIEVFFQNWTHLINYNYGMKNNFAVLYSSLKLATPAQKHIYLLQKVGNEL